MPVAEVYTARKEYKCQHCKGIIKPGQRYWKRKESGKVHNRMTYWFIPWHYDHSECEPHTEKT